MTSKNQEGVNMFKPDPIDVHVGSRLRMRRTFLGMSQGKLGDALNISFQQIQKYEQAGNRISASRLFKLSNYLDVPVVYFFEDLPRQGETQAGNNNEKNPEAFGQDQLAARETLELVRSYYKITNLKVRKRIFDLLKTLAKDQK